MSHPKLTKLRIRWAQGSSWCLTDAQAPSSQHVEHLCRRRNPTPVWGQGATSSERLPSGGASGGRRESSLLSGTCGTLITARGGGGHVSITDQQDSEVVSIRTLDIPVHVRSCWDVAMVKVIINIISCALHSLTRIKPTPCWLTPHWIPLFTQRLSNFYYKQPFSWLLGKEQRTEDSKPCPLEGHFPPAGLSLICSTSPGGYNYPHFTDGQMEAERFNSPPKTHS